MALRFIHASDIHLGYEQYNLAARADDFAKAYLGMVEYAIDVQADFVLIGGDLFHHAHSDAFTIRQAMAGLNQLRTAGIPVVAIEGNHDTTYSQKHLSWLSFLCQEEYLYLLNVQRHENGYPALKPFEAEERIGSYIDLAGARIYGLKYHGAATARLLEEVAPQIEPGPGGYTILMLHAGMEGQIPYLHGGLTMGQIAPFRDRVDYLALGHIHKRLTPDGFIYNPGSTETNSMEEIDWPHGFLDVRVDPSANPKHAATPIATASLRPFRRISIGAEGIASVEDFVAHAEERIGETTAPKKAVIELHLGGVAEFRRQDVPVERLKAVVETRFSPLAVRLRNTLTPPGPISIKGGERTPRAELEREHVEHLVRQMAERRETAGDWTKLILEVKNMAVEHDVPASVADHIRAALARMGNAACPAPETEDAADAAPDNPQPVVVSLAVDVVADVERGEPPATVAPVPYSDLEAPSEFEDW